MEDFGLPQRKRRCIAGNFDFARFATYSGRSRRPTLGETVSALMKDPVVDPLYGLRLPRTRLIDHVEEHPLNVEEIRINRANKTTHPVYNSMPFPDPLDRAVRTNLATCNVARESVVIAAPEAPESLRRLTVRERASLQGFPITFQFYGATYQQKLRMVGNAVPPPFSYLVGHAFLGTPAGDLPPLDAHAASIVGPVPPPIKTPPDRPGSIYPPHRNFRFAIPMLTHAALGSCECRKRDFMRRRTWPSQSRRQRCSALSRRRRSHRTRSRRRPQPRP